MFQNIPSDLDRLLAPVWAGDTVYEESFFPLMKEGEDETVPMTVPLLYCADEILSVTSATRETVLLEGRDYVLRNGSLIIPAGSAVKRFAWSDYHVVGEGEDKYPFPFEGGGKIFFGEGDTMHSREYIVTYRHTDTWAGFVPTADDEALPRTKALLYAGKPVNFCWFGDSITTGANSSACIDRPPYLPMFPEMVCMALEKKYTSKINYVNHAVGGTVSKWGTERLPVDFADEKPDIMFIAFGMNDASERVPAEDFLANIRIMVAQTLALNPDCEFLICSTTLPNALSPRFFYNHEEHEPLLAALCEELGHRAALVPMTSVHKALMTKKRFCDMSGNNINHPCDFLARVYAQTILAQFGE
ncbi:MAG: SGNH/GDSL hydrolase family protein [Clostridia bacterium]|nr:SGNH/GDSL hydrolase family protein [Clostridia bacterium]